MDIEDSYNVRVELLKKPNQNNSFSQCCQIRYCALPSFEEVGTSEVLLQNLYLGITEQNKDIVMGSITPGEMLRGPTLSKVLFSRSPGFDEGDLVFGDLKWQKYQIVQDDQIKKTLSKDIDSQLLNISLLNVSGALAINALKVAKPIQDESVVVTNAAVGVGLIVLQLLLYYYKCKVIAVVETEEQQKFIQESFGIQALIYRDQTFQNQLKEQCPHGFNVFFDNQGGSVFEYSLNNLCQNSRIILTNTNDNSQGISNFGNLVSKSASIQGVSLQNSKGTDFNQINDMLANNMFKVKYTEFDGIDNVPSAIQKIIGGETIGFSIVRIRRKKEDESLRQLELSGTLQPKL